MAKFPIYQVAMNPALAFQQGFNNAQKVQLDRATGLENIEASKQTRAKQRQEMEQSAEEFPLTMDKTQALIDQIRSDTSLDPYRKQLLINQAKEASAKAAHAGDILGMEKGESEFSKQEAKNFADSIKQASQDNQTYDAMIQDVEGFQQAYNRVPSLSKGSSFTKLGGRLMGFYSGDTAAAQKYSSNLIQAIQKLGGKGFRPTDAYRQLVKEGTLSMDTPPDAVSEIGEGIKAKAAQEKQKIHFLGALANMGIRSNFTAEDLWSEYKDKYPALINGVAQPKNAEKWKTFLEKKASGVSDEGEGKSSTELPSGLSEGMIDKYMKKYPDKSRDEIIQAYSKMAK